MAFGTIDRKKVIMLKIEAQPLLYDEFVLKDSYVI
jgi:hypothetical protein